MKNVTRLSDSRKACECSCFLPLTSLSKFSGCCGSLRQTLRHPCDLSSSLVVLFAHCLICIIDCLNILRTGLSGAVSSQDARSLRRRTSNLLIKVRSALQEISRRKRRKLSTPLSGSVSCSLSNIMRYIAAPLTKRFLS